MITQHYLNEFYRENIEPLDLKLWTTTTPDEVHSILVILEQKMDEYRTLYSQWESQNISTDWLPLSIQ